MAVLTADEFEQRLARFLFERSEEARAVRVGEKETSEQAAIVARYSDLFTREQHESLRGEEDAASGDARERLFRLREASAGGIVVGELAEESDRLENALLAERVEFRGESLPLRAAQAKLAVLDEYAAREELGELAGDASAGFNDDRYRLLARAEELDAELSGIADPVRRSAERKGIDLDDLGAALREAARRQDASWELLRGRWVERVLGLEHEPEPGSYHVAYLRRMSPLAELYSQDRAVPVCLETLARVGFDLAANERIRLDLDDRPQKSPRACVIASDPPAVVHLITRAQGGLHDYQAFLHEAAHAGPRSHGDLLFPGRVDHARARLAHRALRPLGGGRRRASRGRALPRGPALPPVRRQARLRARALARLRPGARLRADLRGGAAAGDRLPLPPGRLSGGHGRRLLFGRLPARLDPDGAAARPPAGDDRLRLVAASRDGRAAGRAVHGGNAADERGDRRADRLRAPRHRAAPRGARRGLILRFPS